MGRALGSLKWAVWCATAVSLTACGSAPKHSGHAPPSPMAISGQSHGNYKVGKPYQIDGTWYYPTENWSYDETGIASWYGEQFHGRYTADGETFDLNSLTAAHRTLPMPVVVRVTNLENGRSIKLRVNDRGPYARGRIIDVSRRAAQMLGFEGAGTARVRVQVDVPDSMVVATAAGRIGNTPPTPAAMVASIVSAPLTLPVTAIEAMRGTPTPPPPAEFKVAEARPPAPTPKPFEMKPIGERVEAPPPRPQPQSQPFEMKPIQDPLDAPAARAPVRVAEARPLPPPAPVRVADIRPMAALPQPRPMPRPAATPVSADRPYIMNELPEPGSTAGTASREEPPEEVASQVSFVSVKPTQIYIQAGAFSEAENARRMQERLRGLGAPVKVTAANGGAVYRVRVGPISSVDAADAMLNTVVSNGVAGARIVVD